MQQPSAISLEPKTTTDTVFYPFIVGNDIDIESYKCFFSAERCKYLTGDKQSNMLIADDMFIFHHVNCRSIRKNFIYLKNLLSLMPIKPTTIAVTETWLSVGEETHFSLPGYDFVVHSRATDRAGSVGLYFVKTLNYRLRSDLTMMSDYIEMLIVEVIRKGFPNLLLGSIYYRPQNTDVKVLIPSSINWLTKC